MVARWSEANPRRRRAVRRARLAALALLAALLVLDLIAFRSGTYERPGGGDCGGRSCVDDGSSKGISLAIVIVVAMIVVATWPLLVQRYRRLWPDQDLQHPFA